VAPLVCNLGTRWKWFIQCVCLQLQYEKIANGALRDLLSTSALIRHSLLTKRLTVSRYTCNCNFINSCTKIIAFSVPFLTTLTITPATLRADLTLTN
jgi:hypothetical protein